MRFALPLALVAVLSFTAQARTFEDVNVPEKATVESSQLSLNGVGLRKKFVFSVYVVSLYLPTPAKTPAAAIKPDVPKQLQLVLKRDVDRKAIIDGINEGFERNSKQDLPKLQMRLLQFAQAIPDLKDGQKLIFSYVPGKGTVLGGVAKAMTIPGKDFYDALLGVWLGKDPVDEDLRAALLGKKD
jgi:hypothetical protein